MAISAIKCAQKCPMFKEMEEVIFYLKAKTC